MTDDKAVTRLRNAVLALSGVTNASLDRANSSMTVTFDPTTTDTLTIKNTINGSGFPVD